MATYAAQGRTKTERRRPIYLTVRPLAGRRVHFAIPSSSSVPQDYRFHTHTHTHTHTHIMGLPEKWVSWRAGNSHRATTKPAPLKRGPRKPAADAMATATMTTGRLRGRWRRGGGKGEGGRHAVQCRRTHRRRTCGANSAQMGRINVFWLETAKTKTKRTDADGRRGRTVGRTRHRKGGREVKRETAPNATLFVCPPSAPSRACRLPESDHVFVVSSLLTCLIHSHRAGIGRLWVMGEGGL